MMRQVVVAMDQTDEAGRALAVGAALARRAGAALKALVVVSPTSEASSERSAALAFLEARGVRGVEIEIDQSGDVARAIAAWAGKADTVVCMASHGRAPVAELLVGSVADDVLSWGTGPVVLLGPHVDPAADLATLLVCVDGTSQADAIVPTALRWMDELGLAPVVVEVVTERASPHSRGAARVGAELAASHSNGPAVRVEELVDPDPARAIARLAAHEKGPLVMVAAGTTGRFARLAHGSTTASLVRLGVAPVVAVPVLPSGNDATSHQS